MPSKWRPFRVVWEKITVGDHNVDEHEHPEMMVFQGWAVCWAEFELQAHAKVRDSLAKLYPGGFAVELHAYEDWSVRPILRAHATRKRKATLERKQPSLFRS